jgi:AcrR family transcriptional regulator
VLDAARQLFVEQGYVATTVDQIAERAGVSKPTVFAAVGNKRELLKTVRDVALAGDDEPGPVAARPWYLEVLAEPDQRRTLQLHARNCARINERYAPIEEALHAAAGADAELRDLWRANERERRIGATLVIDNLRKKGPLKKGLTREQACDILWLLMASDHFRRLVADAGWPSDRYRRWLADTFSQQLLE